MNFILEAIEGYYKMPTDKSLIINASKIYRHRSFGYESQNLHRLDPRQFYDNFHDSLFELQLFFIYLRFKITPEIFFNKINSYEKSNNKFCNPPRWFNAIKCI